MQLHLHNIKINLGKILDILFTIDGHLQKVAIFEYVSFFKIIFLDLHKN